MSDRLQANSKQVFDPFEKGLLESLTQNLVGRRDFEGCEGSKPHDRLEAWKSTSKVKSKEGERRGAEGRKVSTAARRLQKVRTKASKVSKKGEDQRGRFKL